MLYYNTAQPQMVLPEYGRIIQNMVDFCMTLPDKEQRTRCAHSIVKTMASLFPQLKGENGDYRNFWDHINVMSGFKLDIDFPCDVIKQENLNPKPKRIQYAGSRPKFRHYGKIIEKMIGKVAVLEDGPEKDELISMVAHHLKKQMLEHNSEAMTDEKVLRDLCEYSDGKISLDPSSYILHDFKVIAAPSNSKKKKKK